VIPEVTAEVIIPGCPVMDTSKCENVYILKYTYTYHVGLRRLDFYWTDGISPAQHASAAFSPGEKTLGYVGIIYIWLVVYDTYNIL